MANTVINGTDVLLFISPATGATTWKAIGAATSHTLSYKMATRVTSNKGTGTLETRAAGRLDVTGSAEGMYVDSSKYNIEDLMKLVTGRVPVMMIFGKETSALSGTPDTTTSGGSHYYASGKFYITSCDSTYPDQGNATFSITFEHASGFAVNHLIVS
jgi:hypothetical protein